MSALRMCDRQREKKTKKTKHVEFPVRPITQGKYCAKRDACKNCSCDDTSVANTQYHNETPTMTLNISRGLAVSVEQSTNKTTATSERGQYAAEAKHRE